MDNKAIVPRQRGRVNYHDFGLPERLCGEREVGPAPESNYRYAGKSRARRFTTRDAATGCMSGSLLERGWPARSGAHRCDSLFLLKIVSPCSQS